MSDRNLKILMTYGIMRVICIRFILLDPKKQKQKAQTRAKTSIRNLNVNYTRRNKKLAQYQNNSEQRKCIINPTL